MMNDNQAIKIIKEVACGEGCKPSICNDSCLHGEGECAFGRAVKALEEIQEYRKIGAPGECRAAVEKQTARKVTTNHSWTHYHFFCPVCNMEVNDMKYCPNCGQKLDWSDEE